MTHFPVSSSILSAVHLSKFLQTKYALDEHTECQLIKAGINHSYHVKDKTKRFIFRIYSLNWRTETDIDEEIRLLNLLKARGLSVAHPLTDKGGNYIQYLDAPEGLRYGVMFSFAEGEKLLNFPEDIHFKAGVLMAQFHQVTQNLTLERVTYSSDVLLQESYAKLLEFLPDDGSIESDFMRTAQAYLLKEYSSMNTSELRHGVVHLDIWFDNLHITKDGDITFFDFDFCGNGFLCLDIAYYILQVYHTERDEALCQLKVESFLQGYESISPISTEEKRILPMLGVSLYFFYLGTQCKRFDNWSNTFLNETYLKRFILALVKRYYDLRGLGKA